MTEREPARKLHPLVLVLVILLLALAAGAVLLVAAMFAQSALSGT